MKKQEKEELRNLKVKQLMEKLEEKQKERNKLETEMRRGHGSSMAIRNYPSKKQQGPFGNLRKIKKDIARIKTFLNVKLKNEK